MMRLIWIVFIVTGVVAVAAEYKSTMNWMGAASTLYMKPGHAAAMVLFITLFLVARIRDRRSLAPRLSMCLALTTVGFWIGAYVIRRFRVQLPVSAYMSLYAACFWQWTAVASAWVLLTLVPLVTKWHRQARTLVLLVSLAYVFLTLPIAVLLMRPGRTILIAGALIVIGVTLLRLRRDVGRFGKIVLVLSIAIILILFATHLMGFGLLQLKPDLALLEKWSRIIAVAFGLLVGMVVLMAISEWMAGMPTRADKLKPVTLTCPSCEVQQRITSTRARCQSCGLRIHLEFEVPRCVCGYRLYGRDVEACPECGRAVAG